MDPIRQKQDSVIINDLPSQQQQNSIFAGSNLLNSRHYISNKFLFPPVAEGTSQNFTSINQAHKNTSNGDPISIFLGQ